MAGNPLATVPPEIDGSFFPVMVFNGPAGAATNATQTAVTLLKAPSSGTYRISFMGTVTAVGTGTGTGTSTISIAYIFTDPLGSTTQSVTYASIPYGLVGDNYDGVVGSQGGQVTGPYQNIFRAKANTAIQFTATYTANGGLTSGPKVQLYAVLEGVSA